MHLVRLLVLSALLVLQGGLLARAAEPVVGHPAISLFKYEPRQATSTSGATITTYQRRRADGRMATYAGPQFEALARQCELFAADNPWTAKVWRNCPGLTDFAATQFEEGAEYLGGSEGDNSHPHAHGRRFWAGEPTFTADDGGVRQTWGDPIDGTTFFIVEALNAVRAADFQAVWDRAIGEHRRIMTLDAPREARRQMWTANRDRWIRDEARIKAENLARTVQMVRTNAVPLHLDENLRLGYGTAYQRYAGWVDQSVVNGRVDLDRLRDAILTNQGTYRDDPEYRGMTYRGRLEKLFAGAMPGP